MPTEFSSEGLAILIVEDHEDTRQLMKVFLRKLGHEVTEAATMKQGAAALAEKRFDVLISDIGLPDGSGWELLHNAPPHAVSLAIATSGLSQATDHAASREAGFQHHLVKPFEPQELADLLGHFVRVG